MVSASLALTALLAGVAASPQTRIPSRPSLPVLDVARLPAQAGEAIRQAYDAASRRHGDLELVGRLAMVQHAWEQWDAAAETYRVAQKLAPDDRRWWYLAGLLETARGRHRAALPLLERAAALEPGNAAGRLRLAEAHLETGDLAGSERLFLDLARSPSTVAAAQYGLGRVAQERGDYRLAVAHLEQAIGAFPDFGAAHYALALAHRRLGRMPEAAEALQRQQKCLPCWPAAEDPVAASVAAVRGDAAAILKRGIALASDGHDEAAVEAHEQALRQTATLTGGDAGATETQARVNLITLYGRIGRWAEAEAHYRQAVAAGVNVAEAHANYAQVVLAQRRAAEAIPIFRQALEANPADASTRNGLGLAREMTGDVERAAEEYRQAVTAAPSLRMARFNYGRALVALGRLGESVAEFEKLRTPEDRDTPRYLFALAAALVRMGNIESGRTEAQAALRMAKRYGLSDLVAEIERDLARLSSR